MHYPYPPVWCIVSCDHREGPPGPLRPRFEDRSVRLVRNLDRERIRFASAFLGLLSQEDLWALGRRFDVHNCGIERTGKFGRDEHIQIRGLRGRVAGLRTLKGSETSAAIMLPTRTHG